MQNKVFNSNFEISLRLLLMLYITDGLTVDRASAYDFMTIYGKGFGVSKDNLHGNNSFSFGEFALRRKKVPEALKTIALDGMADVTDSDRGFLYHINRQGKRVCEELLHIAYAKEYSSVAASVTEKFGDYSEVELLQIISGKSADSLERR